MHAGSVMSHQHDSYVQYKSVRPFIAAHSETRIARQDGEGYIIHFERFGAVITDAFGQVGLQPDRPRQWMGFNAWRREALALAYPVQQPAGRRDQSERDRR